MSETVIVLGGPKHETRVSKYNHNAYNVRMFEARPLDLLQRHPYAVESAYEEIHTISYRIMHLPLGPERRIAAAVHPDLSDTTGLMLLGDLVYATWEKHGVSR